VTSGTALAPAPERDPVRAYRVAFRRFRAHTDEVELLVAAYQEAIRRHRVASLLDIGAGDGAVAIPLASGAATYVAVEADPVLAARLRRAGLDVRCGTFPPSLDPPLDRDQRFDLVLLSHCVSYSAPLAVTEALLRSAWQFVRAGGTMLTVVHRGGGDEFDDLLALVDPGQRDRHREAFRGVWATVWRLGPTQRYDLTTSVRARTPDQLLRILALNASMRNGDLYQQFLSRQEQILRVLTSTYACGDGTFVFPMRHKLLFTESLNGLLEAPATSKARAHRMATDAAPAR
jgi:SAM-dependent methyltransferase